MANFLRFDKQDHIVTLTMDQPETRNALTGNTAAAEFVDACARIHGDSSVRAVVLTGAGPVFSSGGNLKDRSSIRSATSKRRRSTPTRRVRCRARRKASRSRC